MSSTLNTIQKIQVFEPTYRNVLFIISQDESAFTVGALAELYQATSNNIPNPQVAKMISTYTEVLGKGFVKQEITKTTITAKGRFYLLYTSPMASFWVIILGILVTVAIGVINYSPGAKASHSMPTTPKSTQQRPSVDSPLYHQKKEKDSLKKK